MDMNAWEDYYSNPENIRKISYHCKYREVVIIRPVKDRKITLRPLKIFKPEHLQFWIERLDLAKGLFDIYISNASVKIPFPIPSDLTKMKDARQRLNDNFVDWVTGYDIFVDVDIDDESQRVKARNYAFQLSAELKKQGYSKTEVWDTSRGFHIVDKGQFSPEFVKEFIMDTCLELDIPMSIPVKIVDGVKYVAKNKKWVKMKPGEKTPIIPKPNVDTSIYDIRRIRRVPFSLHSKTGKPMRKLI